MLKLGRHLYEIELGNESLVSEFGGRYALRGENDTPDYKELDSPNDLQNVDGIVRSLNSIDWSFESDFTRFLTHDLHPYPAKYIPQIPGTCIAQLSLPGELVFDPFGGSGTTALEAVRMGRRALSTDANAIGTLIGRVKTSNLDRTAVTEIQAIRSAITTTVIDLPDPDVLCKNYLQYIPEIPNIDRWFPVSSRGELALIQSYIGKLISTTARDVASLALSRIILSVSFQESETRYSSKPRNIPQGETLKRYLAALDSIVRNVIRTQAVVRFGISKFITTDSRVLKRGVSGPSSIDLIVTSPPYGNANDYHLYHRFRLLWLGHDPRKLGKIEIGSHLRHQKESSGFDSYLSEVEQSLTGMYRLLKPGRFNVLVVGDAIYKKELYPVAESLSNSAAKIGYDTVCIIEREIHRNKRSFLAAGRRATKEKILVLQKPPKKLNVWFDSPPYKLWPYESVLRGREIKSVMGNEQGNHSAEPGTYRLDPYSLPKARRLVFTHGLRTVESNNDPTWQAILENGFTLHPSARKDPKYATHGLHPYKGKFYPQLAKALMNLCSLDTGATIFDPFCGSGTTLLEGYLNGYYTFGCDMNPLAAKISKAKVGILNVNPDIVREALGALVTKIENAPAKPNHGTEQFAPCAVEEIEKWFPDSVASKINWLLAAIRSVSEGVIKDFLEVVLSSIIRDISQQDPNDLRIRRRKVPIQDADVYQRFIDALDTQYARVAKFWAVRGYSPNRFLPCQTVAGDSRNLAVVNSLGLEENTIDLVLTSPPYATALPYIDTDRLSLLVLFGMDSSKRRPLEQRLIGSREIVAKDRQELEQGLFKDRNLVPDSIGVFLRHLHQRVCQAEVGFRRKNMPALLLRFFHGIATVMVNCRQVLRSGGEVMIVIGDNRIRLDGVYERIPTTDFVQDIAVHSGMDLVERIDISVTTENMVHIKHAITKNIVLRLKPNKTHATHA